MAEISTFIKVDRNIREWRWYKDANTMRVFLHLLLCANIKDHDFEKMTIHRGELVTSYSSLANILGLSVQAVRTAISHLKETGEITSTPYHKFQVISIKNYNSYQADNSQSTGNQQATNSQLTGNQQQSKNDKNDKNEKNGRNILGDKPPAQTRKAFVPPSVEEVRTYCTERSNGIDAEYFVDYYTANGWMVGKTKMRDWKATVRKWERNNYSRKNQTQTAERSNPDGADSRIFEGII